MNAPRVVRPDWPAPDSVRAVCTTRQGGTSEPPFASLNLGANTGDDPAAVAGNRKRLENLLALPSSPSWLDQQHGNVVVKLDQPAAGSLADATVTGKPGIVLAVLTADCLPVLVCNRGGTQVAAIHAGWRGLAAGILPAALSLLPPGSDLIAWLGPAIGRNAYEVGPDVRQAITAAIPDSEQHFYPCSPDRWLADLPGMARAQLTAMGVGEILGGSVCTHSDAENWFSHRRDGHTGRMATLIWLDS